MLSKRTHLSVARVLCLLFAILALLFTGCHRSGTWNDSPKNWERAFGQKPPKDVQVIHSSYWRSPHFTLEYEYFFQVKAIASYRTNFNAPGKLQSFSPTSKEEKEAIQRFFHEKPRWFIPKSIEQYEIWKARPEDRDYENFRLFIDLEDGTMFLTEYSV